MGGFVRLAIVVAMVVDLAACWSSDVPVAEPTVLSSPGPLIAGHSSLDDVGACNSCHVDNSPEIDARKCVDCHQQLRQRLVQGKGFHAAPVVRGKPCVACHADHRGRGFDPMGWRSLRGGRPGFDHTQTGWPLHGPHAGTDCRTCHSATDTQGLELFIGTSRLCGTCHGTPHNTTSPALQSCDRCHYDSAWQPPLPMPQFNHDDRKDARMPLIGVHAGVKCVDCHARGLFSLGLKQPDRCENCHATPHAGQLFANTECSKCHSPTFKSFTATVIFDHGERTRFDLGGHKALACNRCHTAALGTAKPPLACESCHAAKSPHADRFKALGSPPACQQCHSSNFGATPQPKWQLRTNAFDHRKTKFPLVGKHTEIACRACHRGKGPTDFEKLDASKGCMGCHEHEDVHDQKFTNNQCVQCHVQF